jgi:putative phosphoesterase
MKILVFSDSHAYVEIMVKVTEHEKPDVIFHCGDYLKDALELQKHIDIPLHYVAGNCDTADEDLYEKYAEIGGKRFLLIHGHQSGIADDYWNGMKKLFFHRDDVDIVLYGHTHEPLIYRCDKRWLFNPGSIIRADEWKYSAGSTYGLIHLNEDDNNNIRFEIVQTPEYLFNK